MKLKEKNVATRIKKEHTGQERENKVEKDLKKKGYEDYEKENKEKRIGES